MASIPADLQPILQELSQPARLSDMSRRIKLCRRALTQFSKNDHLELWAALQNELGLSYTKNPEGRRVDNLEQAIEHFQQALEVMTRQTSPEQWAATQLNLANAFFDRLADDRAANLEQAIKHFNQALKVYTRLAFPKDWASTHNDLGNTFSIRLADDRAANLEQAIKHFNQALKVYTRPAFPKDWALIQHNLAAVFSDRIDGERADNLEQAIFHHHQALEILTRRTFPEQWAQTQNSLGEAYRMRIKGERADNLEQAIFHYHQALEILTRQTFPEQWAQTQNNLGIAYFDRIAGERAVNLEQAISHFQEALEVRTRHTFPEQWAQTQNNLGIAHFNRLARERADGLEQAIFHYHQALEVLKDQAFPEQWAMIENNLGNAFLERMVEERVDNIEKAIFHFEQALKVFTHQAFPERWAMTQHNLANAYADRIQGERADNLEQAIHHYQQALEVRTRAAFPADHRQTQRNQGHLYFGERRWPQAEAAYQGAIAAGRDLLASAATEIGRQAEVRETAQLYARTAYAHLKQGQVTAALQTLEEGKTRLLTEALALAEADLESLPLDQRQAVARGREVIRQLEAEMRLPPATPVLSNVEGPGRRDERELAQALGQARTELNQLIAAIRRDQPDFMPTGLDLPALLALIPPGGALVAPLVTSQGSAVFVVPHGVDTIGEEHVVWLNEMTNETVQSWLIGTEEEPGWLREYGDYLIKTSEAMTILKEIEVGARSVSEKQGALKKIEQANDKWQTAIGRITGMLWHKLTAPIDQRFQSFGLVPGSPLLLMPQGRLGLLPLHAAWRQDNGQKRYWLDEYQITYAPSGYALQAGRRRLQESPRQDRSLLAVVNPTQDLAFTPVEGEQVVKLFGQALSLSLNETEATLAAVKQSVAGRSYLHFSCHGYYHWQEAMQSGLLLANREPLTLAQLIGQVDLEAARLVVLSACETGITEFQESPDEFIGLPAGFIQAGAPGVVSTLWAVDDLSTMLLMEKFYQFHLQDGLEIAEALRQAQRWLRAVTAGELAERFEMEGQTLLASTRMPVDVVSRQYRRFNNMALKKRPFEHPYYWAAFTFSGA